MSYYVYLNSVTRVGKYHESECTEIKSGPNWLRELSDINAVFHEAMALEKIDAVIPCRSCLPISPVGTCVGCFRGRSNGGSQHMTLDPHYEDNMTRERLYADESFPCRICGNDGEVGADLAAAINVTVGLGHSSTHRTWVHKTCGAKELQRVNSLEGLQDPRQNLGTWQPG